jgi:hypothetical protein
LVTPRQGGPPAPSEIPDHPQKDDRKHPGFGELIELNAFGRTGPRSPPADNIQDYFESSFGIYKGKNTREVILRFSPVKSKWIKDRVWHKDQKMKFFEDGSLELSFPVADFSEIKMEILKHGGMVEVIKPKSLQRLIKTEAQNIARIYENQKKVIPRLVFPFTSTLSSSFSFFHSLLKFRSFYP